MFPQPPTPVPPPSAAEYIGYALTREAEAEHYMQLGLQHEALHHWRIANQHRKAAEDAR